MIENWALLIVVFVLFSGANASRPAHTGQEAYQDFLGALQNRSLGARCGGIQSSDCRDFAGGLVDIESRIAPGTLYISDMLSSDPKLCTLADSWH